MNRLTALFYRLRLGLLLSLLIGFHSHVYSQTQEVIVKMGAEIESPVRYLAPFMKFIDFDDLEARFSQKMIETFYYSEIRTRSDFVNENEDAVLRKFLRYFDQATQDMPISMGSFFQQIPQLLKQQLTEGLDVNSMGSILNIKSAEATIAEISQKTETSQIEIPKLEIPKNGLILNEKKQTALLKYDEQVEKAKKELFWQTVNKRWNALPVFTRLYALPWRQLPQAAQSQIVMQLYQMFSHPGMGPQLKGFKPDVLELKFSDAKVSQLYAEFYPTRDSKSILEFHTLNPQEFGAFMRHLKGFLNFIGQSQAVLFPGHRVRNDMSLHVHISSSKWEKADYFNEMVPFIRLIKFHIALEGYSRGDISTILYIPNPGSLVGAIGTDPDVKDVATLRSSTSEPYRIEIRYFHEDVEKELQFYNSLASREVSVARKVLLRRILKTLTRERLMQIVHLRPADFHLFMGPELLEALNLTNEEIHKIAEISKRESQKLPYWDDNYLATYGRKTFYQINHHPSRASVGLYWVLYKHARDKQQEVYSFLHDHRNLLMGEDSPLASERELQYIQFEAEAYERWTHRGQCKELLKKP